MLLINFIGLEGWNWGKPPKLIKFAWRLSLEFRKILGLRGNFFARLERAKKRDVF
jgi:hypothetical protein